MPSYRVILNGNAWVRLDVEVTAEDGARFDQGDRVRLIWPKAAMGVLEDAE